MHKLQAYQLQDAGAALTQLFATAVESCQHDAGQWHALAAIIDAAWEKRTELNAATKGEIRDAVGLRPVRAAKSAAFDSVLKAISMFLPSAASSRTPLLSSPPSKAMMPVCAAMRLIAVITASRVACGLFSTVVICGEV